MDIQSNGYYTEILNRVSPAIKLMARAIKNGSDPGNYDIPITASIRKMQQDGVDVGRMKAYLSDAIDYTLIDNPSIQDKDYKIQNRLTVLINRNVDYQTSLDKGNGLTR